MSSAEDKRKQRARKRSEGYVLKQIWVKPGTWPEIKRFVDEKNADNLCH